jgi:hypothetical protein
VQTTLNFEDGRVHRKLDPLVVHSSRSHLEHFEEMPDGWRFDHSWGSPESGYEPICNGKSVLNGGRKGLLRVEKSNCQPILDCSKRIAPKPTVEKAQPTSEDRADVARVMNELARAKFKERLLQDLIADLMVCKIEGWSVEKYITDLKTLIDQTAESVLHNVTGEAERSDRL